MRVHLIKKQAIEDYVSDHAASKSAFTHWLNSIRNADWKTPEDILSTFGTADLLGNSSFRVIFNRIVMQLRIKSNFLG